jgi:hypothetical protein
MDALAALGRTHALRHRHDLKLFRIQQLILLLPMKAHRVAVLPSRTRHDVHGHGVIQRGMPGAPFTHPADPSVCSSFRNSRCGAHGMETPMSI